MSTISSLRLEAYFSTFYLDVKQYLRRAIVDKLFKKDYAQIVLNSSRKEVSEMFENVSIIALVASGIAAMVIGYVWYGPLFGKSWMKEAHVSENDIKAAEKEMPKTYGLTFIASLVQAYVLSMFINYAGAIDYVSAATVAFWVWLGFVVTIRLYDTLFERKPTNLFGINIGYSLITFVVMSAILITL